MVSDSLADLVSKERVFQRAGGYEPATSGVVTPLMGSRKYWSVVGNISLLCIRLTIRSPSIKAPPVTTWRKNLPG